MTITDYQITTTTTDDPTTRKGAMQIVSAELCRMPGFLDWLMRDTIRAIGTNHIEWSIRPVFEDETPTTHSGPGEGD